MYKKTETNTAFSLGQLANSVIKELGFIHGEFSFLGSILQHCEQIKTQTAAYIEQKFPQMVFTKPEHNASTGAALYALNMCKD